MISQQYTLGIFDTGNAPKFFPTETGVERCHTVAIQAPPGTELNLKSSNSSWDESGQTITVGLTGIYQLSFVNKNIIFDIRVDTTVYEQIKENGASPYIIIDAIVEGGDN